MKAQAVNAAAYYTCHKAGAHKLPNAAEKRYRVEKLVDSLLSAAITLGVLLISMVLITM